MSAVERCGHMPAHTPHGGCPGREKCVRCGVLTWCDQMVEITELRLHNGTYRHPGCRL